MEEQLRPEGKETMSGGRGEGDWQDEMLPRTAIAGDFSIPGL